jgi:hypothetical protein
LSKNIKLMVVSPPFEFAARDCGVSVREDEGTGDSPPVMTRRALLDACPRAVRGDRWPVLQSYPREAGIRWDQFDADEGAERKMV